ncbi:uncharacterized protein LOC127871169 [Dreissena polymorpha]|nr:uncharacterized protein LOC127871169 [Dreissena polymorpha]
MKQNSVVQEVGLDACRLNDKTLKLLGHSIGSLADLQRLHIGSNLFTPQQASLFLASLVNNPGALVYVNIQGVPATDQLKAAAGSLLTVHNLLVNFDDPPARREVTRDVLTRNLVQIVEFMEKFGITVEDLFPDYEDEDEDGQLMITIKEVFVAMECCGLISKFDKLQKLRERLQQGKGRKFSIQEFSKVYESVCSGQDTLRAAPLRTHLRKSLKEEREEKERQRRQSKQRRRVTPLVPAALEDE